MDIKMKLSVTSYFQHIFAKIEQPISTDTSEQFSSNSIIDVNFIHFEIYSTSLYQPTYLAPYIYCRSYEQKINIWIFVLYNKLRFFHLLSFSITHILYVWWHKVYVSHFQQRKSHLCLFQFKLIWFALSPENLIYFHMLSTAVRHF
jgi:hypothetical protein